MQEKRDDRQPITITLSRSRNARAFGSDELLFAEQLRRAEQTVNGHFDEVRDVVARNPGTALREARRAEFRAMSRTLFVVGGRGTGKTSFLLSLRDTLKSWSNGATAGASSPRLQVLGPVDPGKLENGEAFLATVVSLLLRSMPSTRGPQEPLRDDTLNAALQRLARALPVITDGRAPSFRDGADMELLAQDLLEWSHSGIVLADAVEDYLDAHCEALGLDGFVLLIDDVDLALGAAWPVLETVRRYLRTARMFVVLTGDLELYRMIVRKEQWRHLKELTDMERTGEPGGSAAVATGYRRMVDGLQEQYLLKLFPVGDRIEIGTFLDLVGGSGFDIRVRTTPDSDGRRSLLELLRTLDIRVFGRRNLHRLGLAGDGSSREKLERHQVNAEALLLLREPTRTVMRMLDGFVSLVDGSPTSQPSGRLALDVAHMLRHIYGIGYDRLGLDRAWPDAGLDLTRNLLLLLDWTLQVSREFAVRQPETLSPATFYNDPDTRRLAPAVVSLRAAWWDQLRERLGGTLAFAAIVGHAASAVRAMEGYGNASRDDEEPRSTATSANAFRARLLQPGQPAWSVPTLLDEATYQDAITGSSSWSAPGILRVPRARARRDTRAAILWSIAAVATTAKTTGGKAQPSPERLRAAAPLRAAWLQLARENLERNTSAKKSGTGSAKPGFPTRSAFFPGDVLPTWKQLEARVPRGGATWWLLHAWTANIQWERLQFIQVLSAWKGWAAIGLGLAENVSRLPGEARAGNTGDGSTASDAMPTREEEETVRRLAQFITSDQLTLRSLTLQTLTDVADDGEEGDDEDESATKGAPEAGDDSSDRFTAFETALQSWLKFTRELRRMLGPIELPPPAAIQLAERVDQAIVASSRSAPDTIAPSAGDLLESWSISLLGALLQVEYTWSTGIDPTTARLDESASYSASLKSPLFRNLERLLEPTPSNRPLVLLPTFIATASCPLILATLRPELRSRLVMHMREWLGRSPDGGLALPGYLRKLLPDAPGTDGPAEASPDTNSWTTDTVKWRAVTQHKNKNVKEPSTPDVTTILQALMIPPRRSPRQPAEARKADLKKPISDLLAELLPLVTTPRPAEKASRRNADAGTDAAPEAEETEADGAKAGEE